MSLPTAGRPALCSCLLIAALMPAASAHHTTANDNSLTPIQSAYIAADKALRNNQLSRWRKLEPHLIDYPLYPYLKLREIRAAASNYTHAEIAEIVRNTDIPLPNWFKNWWLQQLVSAGDWGKIVEHYSSSKKPSARCIYARALMRSNRPEQAAHVIRDLWLVPRSQVKQCDPVFEYARQNNIIDDRLIWDRIVLAKHSGQHRLAKYLSSLIQSESVRHWVTRLDRAHAHPRDTTRANFKNWSDSSFGADAIGHAITRIARKDIEEAAAIWSELKAAYPQASARLAGSETNIARRLAIHLHPDAYEWLANLPESQNSVEILRLRMRAAIANESWDSVLATADLMSPDEAGRNEWVFWTAYAYYETGEKTKAEALWRQIASNFNFYGLLASDRIDIEYSFRNQHDPATPAMTESEAYRAPVIRRIEQWLALGRPYSARRELLDLPRDIDTGFWFHAAALFNRWQWHDGAVRAMRRAGDYRLGRLDILFPTPYIESVRKEAKRYDVPTYWIYGIMRQESNFVADIRSSAGAIGLMQLLPSTARATAKRLKLKNVTTYQLTRAALNVRLGTAYFKGILNRMDSNPVYALAGYNAGPRRSNRWQARSRSSDTAIWVETIPFSETRGYVKNILVNFIVYENLLQSRASRVSDYLPPLVTQQVALKQ